MRASIEVINVLQNGLKENKNVAGICIDITKAFGSVDHTILLDKLWAFSSSWGDGLTIGARPFPAAI